MKLTAIDTIILNVITDVLREKCEGTFSEYSHAYRPERGVATALQQYCYYAEKYNYAAKIDPIACFDNIDRTVLQNAI